VGAGTFKPLAAKDIREHTMESERYILTENAAGKLRAAKAEGRRIIAVGTTTTRCLEANFRAAGRFEAGEGEADIYIYPGYRFAAIDGLITNFHLPDSTLILLVSALAGRERIMELYSAAIEREYRFYSFGDAMLLLP
jgi:S-adenosylmethionine:tRNA ribosyltransferase-isomerase